MPITGTAISYADGGYGDLNDPIRLINIDLGNVSWKLIKLDLENDVAEIEVTPGSIFTDTGQKNEYGVPIYTERPATPGEQQAILAHTRSLVEGHTKEELYQTSGSPKLKKPEKSLEIE